MIRASINFIRPGKLIGVITLAQCFVITSLVVGGELRAGALSIGPDTISIGPRTAHERILISYTDDAGFTRDVTAEATIAVADPSIAAWKAGHLHAASLAAPADTTITAAYGGLTAVAKLHVIPSTACDVSFQTEVVPVLMRYGCNSGGCHGASRGKQGFRLSLFGYDPDVDHFRLTREFVNRRINLADPDDSLLLKKSANLVPHGGGNRLGPDDPNFALLRKWIAEGAQKEPDDAPKMIGVRVYPDELTLDAAGQTHRLVVIGDFSDGSRRDVTQLAILETSDASVATIDAMGTVTSKSRGQVFASVRLPAFITGVRVDVVPAPTGTVEYPQPFNFIDELVMARLKKLRIVPSEVADDRTFIRRVFIDTIGLLPTPTEVQAFVADSVSDKRSRLIDQLLDREEFIDLWTMKWMERLQARSVVSASSGIQKATIKYNGWMREQIAAGTPINQIFRSMIASSGSWIEQPETNFFRERDQRVLMENMSQLFLGARVQCAQCHNHPFDRWTQNDYYHFAAFFARVRQKPMEDPQDKFIYEASEGEMTHPVSKRAMEPKFLGGATPQTGARDRRLVLADWLTSPDNDLVARNIANIYWHHFFGVGIIDPVDDVRVSNPPSNPALLAALAERLGASNFNQKSLIREILNSRTYQLTSTPNQTNAEDYRNFARCHPRRPGAEVLLDLIVQVTGKQQNFYMERPGTRAVQIVDGNFTNNFLTTFGRSSRNTACTCEVKSQPTLSQALHLINGETVTDDIRKGGRIKRWLTELGSPQAVAGRIFETSLGRAPSEPELRAFEARLAASPDDAEAALEDLCWAVLNSSEFMFNH